MLEEETDYYKSGQTYYITKSGQEKLPGFIAIFTPRKNIGPATARFCHDKDAAATIDR